MPLTPGARRRALPLLLSITMVSTVALQGLAAAQPQPLEADDAGSGRDAGFTFETAVPVQLDTTYAAALAPGAEEYVLVPTDLFTFEVTAGQELSVWLEADGVVCADVVDVAGEIVASGSCQSHTIPLPVTADATLGLRMTGTADPALDYTFRIDSLPVFPAPSATPSNEVVVAVQSPDGVNPYHEVYRRPSLTSHPCTRVDGFTDCTIPALELTLDGVDSLEDAVAADADVWDSVVPGQWYWIPGTNIIGAACGPTSGFTTCILGDGGTPSAVLSEAPDALLLVGDSAIAPSQAFATAPVVPDLQAGGAPTTLAHLVGRATDVPFDGVAPAPANPATLLFQAAPNAFHGPVYEVETITAGPEVQVVTGTRPGSIKPLTGVAADFASYDCRPLASGSALTGTVQSCGSDEAAVTAAGAAAAVLQTLRQQDGSTARSTGSSVSATVSRDAFVAGLRAAASYDPEPKYAAGFDHGVDVPEGQEHLSYGYGWLDSEVATDIVSCIRDTTTCPERSAESIRYNDARRQSREVAPAVLGTVPGNPVPSDDAGSGRDAGDDLTTAGAIDLATAYTGSLVPLPGNVLERPLIAVPGDTDWFTFEAQAGQRVTVDIDVPGDESAVACLEIRAASGESLAEGCGVELSAVVPTSGTYVFEIGYSVTANQPYGFTVS